MVTSEESAGRIVRLQRKLGEQGLDGALLVHSMDVYYFSGTRQNAVLWVPAEGGSVLMVRKSLSRALEECALNDVRPFPPTKEFSDIFPAQMQKLGLTFDVLPVAQYNYFAKLLPDREFVNISDLIRELRSVKSSWELERVYFGGKRLSSVFAQIPEFLRLGMREVDLAAEFEARLRKAGGEGYVRVRAFNQELFIGLAVSGTCACSPGFFDGPVTGRGMSSASPHGASGQIIEKNTPVLVDYIGVFDGYIVDMTRIFVVGFLPPQLQRAFEVALAIQEEMVRNLKPGRICADLFAQALKMAEEAGLAGNFMGAPGENAKFVGHGVGLELDEFPILAQGVNLPLQAGQTIAIEPKFVIPDHGVVGIENTFAVAEGGGEKITDLPDAITFL